MLKPINRHFKLGGRAILDKVLLKTTQQEKTENAFDILW